MKCYLDLQVFTELYTTRFKHYKIYIWEGYKNGWKQLQDILIRLYKRLALLVTRKDKTSFVYICPYDHIPIKTLVNILCSILATIRP